MVTKDKEVIFNNTIYLYQYISLRYSEEKLNDIKLFDLMVKAIKGEIILDSGGFNYYEGFDDIGNKIKIYFKVYFTIETNDTYINLTEALEEVNFNGFDEESSTYNIITSHEESFYVKTNLIDALLGSLDYRYFYDVFLDTDYKEPLKELPLEDSKLFVKYGTYGISSITFNHIYNDISVDELMNQYTVTIRKYGGEEITKVLSEIDGAEVQYEINDEIKFVDITIKYEGYELIINKKLYDESLYGKRLWVSYNETGVYSYVNSLERIIPKDHQLDSILIYSPEKMEFKTIDDFINYYNENTEIYQVSITATDNASLESYHEAIPDVVMVRSGSDIIYVDFIKNEIRANNFTIKINDNDYELFTYNSYYKLPNKYFSVEALSSPVSDDVMKVQITAMLHLINLRNGLYEAEYRNNMVSYNLNGYNYLTLKNNIIFEYTAPGYFSYQREYSFEAFTSNIPTKEVPKVKAYNYIIKNNIDDEEIVYSSYDYHSFPTVQMEDGYYLEGFYRDIELKLKLERLPENNATIYMNILTNEIVDIWSYVNDGSSPMLKETVVNNFTVLIIYSSGEVVHLYLSHLNDDDYTIEFIPIDNTVYTSVVVTYLEYEFNEQVMLLDDERIIEVVIDKTYYLTLNDLETFLEKQSKIFNIESYEYTVNNESIEKQFTY